MVFNSQGKYIPLNSSWFAVSDCSNTGQLTSDYSLLKRLYFFSNERKSEGCCLFTCSCKDSATQSARLMCTSSLLFEDSVAFKLREEKQYCIHRRILPRLHCDSFPILNPVFSENEDQTSDAEPIAILSLTPLRVAVFSGQ